MSVMELSRCLSTIIELFIVVTATAEN